MVICKHQVVGKYRPQQFDLLSWDYLQWWFVDRLMEMWESIVGRFVLETKCIWFFYWLLGADLAWTAKIESYIQEVDLVSVGDNTTIGHPINCRKFSHSKGKSPKMIFRPIVIGQNCTVQGMISPGGKLGEAVKVEKLSVVEEGAQVPSNVLAQGNPACNHGSRTASEPDPLEESILEGIQDLLVDL